MHFARRMWFLKLQANAIYFNKINKNDMHALKLSAESSTVRKL